MPQVRLWGDAIATSFYCVEMELPQNEMYEYGISTVFDCGEIELPYHQTVWRWNCHRIKLREVFVFQYFVHLAVV